MTIEIIITLCLHLGTTLCAVIGFAYGVKLRLDRIEEILLHGDGLMRRQEMLERTLASQVALCAERHRSAARE